MKHKLESRLLGEISIILDMQMKPPLWQKVQTEELYQKDLNDPDNHDGVITHLDPDILLIVTLLI